MCFVYHLKSVNYGLKWKSCPIFGLTPFYDGEKKRLFMEYVHDTQKMISWVNSKKIEWTHAMVYDRRTREKLDRIKNR